MTNSSPTSGYSPPIRVTLELETVQFDVAEVGLEHIALRAPDDWGPTQALLIINIDGRERRYRVMLPDGIDSTRDKQPLIRLETMSLAEAR
jgi:hypothetical protein